MTAILWGAAVFGVVVVGLGLPVVRALRIAPADRPMVAVLSGIVLAGLLGEALHLAGASTPFWRLPALLAGIGWVYAWREITAWSRHPASRIAVRNWLVVSAGSLLALGVIRTYSGGDWIGDWVGHYHRAHYFLHPDPADAWIFDYDPFAARPPLLNLATATLLGLTVDRFAFYQVSTTLLSSAAVLPFTRLVAVAGGRRRMLAALPLLLMVNPLFVQNATYSWTKLGSAAFVLASGYFFVRAARTRRFSAWLLAALSITAGVLAHYSAAPYALAFVAGYFAFGLRPPRNPRFWRESLTIGLAAGALAATWFAWAVAREGIAATLTENTSVSQAQALDAGGELRAFLLNFWRTVLPPYWPGADLDFIRHGNPMATLRDFAFVFYQTSLPGMAGLGGLVVLLAALSRMRLSARRWIGATGAVLGFVALAVAVHPAPMRWGAGHICLQPLGLAMAALAAAALSRIPPALRRLAVAGWMIDAALGVILHLGIEHIDVPPAVVALSDGGPLRELYGLAMANNAAARQALDLVLVGDTVSPLALLVGAAVVLPIVLAPLRQASS